MFSSIGLRSHNKSTYLIKRGMFLKFFIRCLQCHVFYSFSRTYTDLQLRLIPLLVLIVDIENGSLVRLNGTKHKQKELSLNPYSCLVVILLYIVDVVNRLMTVKKDKVLPVFQKLRKAYLG
jgi:hypothetical protein